MLETLLNKYAALDYAERDTDEINLDLRALLANCDEVYFKPLSDKKASGDISLQAVALIHRLTAELTSRYLLTGF